MCHLSVRPEPVEGLSFFFWLLMKAEVKGFDKLSPNGLGNCK